MPKQALNMHLRQFYEAQQASAQKQAQLLEMADMLNKLSTEETEEEAHHKKTHTRSDKTFRGPRLKLGLSLALAVIFAVFFFLPSVDISQGVAKEIVLNHKKGLALEFPSENATDLGKQMPKLDFTLHHSKTIDTQGLRMIGGRYCSIQGEIAAQIRLQDKVGRIYTLYQTALTDELLTLKTGERQQDGLKLKLWREAGLFFGLVGPMD